MTRRGFYSRGCYACGTPYEAALSDPYYPPCPRCGKAPGWTNRPREALRAVRLHRLREAGRLDTDGAARLFAALLTRVYKNQPIITQAINQDFAPTSNMGPEDTPMFEFRYGRLSR